MVSAHDLAISMAAAACVVNLYTLWLLKGQVKRQTEMPRLVASYILHTASGTRVGATMIRLIAVPLAVLVFWTVRILRTPWCQILDHTVVLDPVSGLMCRRCGTVLRTITTPPKDDR